MSGNELRHLRSFVTVAEERHFGRAASRLYITQSGLSQQIKMLERSVGAQLFMRTTRHVELTRAGEALLDHAELLLELAERAHDAVRVAQLGKRGVLKVGTGVAGTHPVATEALRRFLDRFRDIEVDVQTGFTPHHLDALARRNLDVAVLILAAGSPGPPFQLLCETYEVEVALPERHPLARLRRIPHEALLAEPFIPLPRFLNAALIEHVSSTLFGDTVHPRQIDVPEGLQRSRLELVARGEGITPIILPWADRVHVSGTVRRQLEEPVPLLECRISWYGDHISPHVPDFVEIARGLAEPVAAAR